MSFAAIFALAIGAFVALPLLAHLLRRGKTKEVEFPPALLVPAHPSTLRERSRLEDRALFSLRALMIIALAILGATPFVRCSRLSVARPSGASVALALVIDDSHSMQCGAAGNSRFAQALTGASELLASARNGDAISIVLAGAPARVLLSATTDLTSVKETLSVLKPSDRSTDLNAAVKLAEGTLGSLPHLDKRIVMLSDLAAPSWDAPLLPVWTPLAALSTPLDNCAITAAELQGGATLVNVACSSLAAARGRSVEAVVHTTAPAATGSAGKRGADAGPAASASEAGQVVDKKPLIEQAGVQSVRLTTNQRGTSYDVKLLGEDACPSDDVAPVASNSTVFSVGIVADPAKASVITGGPTVLEQALGAGERAIQVRPLGIMPETAPELAPLAALLIDDPPGLAPEVRSALTAWAEQGGVALALLGPSSRAAGLASNLEPFARAGHWEDTRDALDVDPRSVGWLGDEASSLAEVTRAGRMRLEGAEFPDSAIVGRWSDGAPFLISRPLGNGLLLTAGLPASVDVSDFALRPAFLAVLDHVVEQAELRRGPRQSLAGATWTFNDGGEVRVTGPQGLLPLVRAERRTANSSAGLTAGSEMRPAVVIEHLGRYRVVGSGTEQERVVTIAPDEILAEPKQSPNQALDQAAEAESQVDISPELAFFILLLVAAEMLIRVLRPVLPRGARGATTS